MARRARRRYAHRHQEALDSKVVDWMEQVSEEQYRADDLGCALYPGGAHIYWIMKGLTGGSFTTWEEVTRWHDRQRA